MTPEAITYLIRAGETHAVEFKGEEKAVLSDHDLVENIVCLANRMGDDEGWLLIGVEDDGRVTGARPRHEAGITDLARLASLIAGRAWHLSAATYRRLGAKAAYVRQRGFEPAQQEQIVLQYVEKHGRITRKEGSSRSMELKGGFV
ncbi:MAG: ATP-binding protein [Spirochaetia bacterium]|jgi:GTPase